MGPVSRWAVNRPVLALIVWFIGVIAIFALGGTLKGEFNDSFTLPNTQSQMAQEFLQEINSQGGAAGTTATIVWSPASGDVTDDAVKQAIAPTLKSVAALGSVTCVTSPYDDTYGRACPDTSMAPLPSYVPQEIVDQIDAATKAAKKATSPISTDKKVAYATVSFEGAQPMDIPATDVNEFVALVGKANSTSLQVGASGQVVDAASSSPPLAEAVGILAAIIILLIAFGSLVAAGVPIIVAITGLAAGQMLILVVARFLDVATFAPELAAMIGLGVGIDYALFVTSRFRQEMQDGAEPKAAAIKAVDSAGRAVAFAGTTVIIALLGLFVLGVPFFYGLSIAAGVAVLMVMLSALIMLPALLSLLGTKSMAIKMPWARHPKPFDVDSSRWARYGGFLQKAPWLFALLAVIVVGVLAIPGASLRLGFPDDGTAPTGSPQRIGFDLLSEGFGPGYNGPFYVAVYLPLPKDDTGVGNAIDVLSHTPGVASTVPNKDMLDLYKYDDSLYSDTGVITSIVVYPTTAPQDPATATLLQTLRDEAAPKILKESNTTIYMGGTQAVATDFTTVLIDVLPLFLFVVIGLGFLALMVLFRSLLIPLTAAITSLLSFAAALGVTVAIFQWGWGASLLGVSGTGPILPFLPVMVFAILFGLSMDYQVFLVSRMQEGYHASGDNKFSVRHGLGGSGRVVVSAALIMTSVFLAFVPEPNDTIKLFGVALATAVMVDAFIVRLVLVPSFMSMCGRGNWWLPKWLNKVLPHFTVE